MKFKICGMKYQDNIQEVAKLHPEYLGFVFYNKSKRNFEGRAVQVLKNIKKVGVFVDATIQEITSKIKKYNLDAIQLHGDESPEFCTKLKTQFCHAEPVSASQTNNGETLKQVQGDVELIKVFSVGSTFDFEVLQPYENICDYFLFDTKGKEKGGNGIVFDWKLLEDYPSKKPYFLSGGIGLDEVESIKLFLQSKASKYCFALDVNSRFEIRPGLKEIEKLKEFKKSLEIGE